MLLTRRTVIALLSVSLLTIIYAYSGEPNTTIQVDNPPTITGVHIEKTHRDPSRIRASYTFYLDFFVEATDDNLISQVLANITHPDGTQTVLDMPEASGIYVDTIQAREEGNYSLQFIAVDNSNQKTVSETTWTISYSTYAKYLQCYLAKGWNQDFLVTVYQLDKGTVESLYGTPSLDTYLELIDEIGVEESMGVETVWELGNKSLALGYPPD